MDLQWNRIPKIYEKSVDAYGIKSKTQVVCDYAIGTTLIHKTALIAGTVALNSIGLHYPVRSQR